MTRSRVAADVDRKRLNNIVHELNSYFNDRNMSLQDRVNVCLNMATELVIMRAVDQAQTRTIWLEHCAVIYDEIVTMLSGAKA